MELPLQLLVHARPDNGDGPTCSNHTEDGVQQLVFVQCWALPLVSEQQWSEHFCHLNVNLSKRKRAGFGNRRRPASPTQGGFHVTCLPWDLAVCWGVMATISKVNFFLSLMVDFLRVQGHKEASYPSMPLPQWGPCGPPAATVIWMVYKQEAAASTAVWQGNTGIFRQDIPDVEMISGEIRSMPCPFIWFSLLLDMSGSFSGSVLTGATHNWWRWWLGV